MLLQQNLARLQRNSPMPAECIPKPMRFARLKGRDPVADFRGGALTSDAGALLLGQVEAHHRHGVRLPSCRCLRPRAPPIMWLTPTQGPNTALAPTTGNPPRHASRLRRNGSPCPYPTKNQSRPPKQPESPQIASQQCTREECGLAFTRGGGSARRRAWRARSRATWRPAASRPAAPRRAARSPPGPDRSWTPRARPRPGAA